MKYAQEADARIAELSKRVMNSIIEEIAKEEPGATSDASPEYDELTDKIGTVCEGYELSLIMASLIDVMLDAVRFFLDHSDQSEEEKSAKIDWLMKRVFISILAVKDEYL
jgi:hypothetical protein